MISPGGAVKTFAGQAGLQGADDGAAPLARFRDPHAVTVDRTGTIFVADTGNNTLRKITVEGRVSTFAGADQIHSPQSIGTDAAGNIYVANAGDQNLLILTPEGKSSLLPADGDLGHPDALAVDAAGDVFVADAKNNVIRQLLPAETTRAAK
jgi:DNA-binding beta-propeller fold protein YncE